jgi:hypothetical protein
MIQLPFVYLVGIALCALALGAGCFVGGVRIGMRVAFAARKPLADPGKLPELFGGPPKRELTKKYKHTETSVAWNQRAKRLTKGERDALQLALAEGRLDPAIRKLVEEELKN